MAKYKNYDYSQGRFIPVYFDKQILPGTWIRGYFAVRDLRGWPGKKNMQEGGDN